MTCLQRLTLFALKPPACVCWECADIIELALPEEVILKLDFFPATMDENLQQRYAKPTIVGCAAVLPGHVHPADGSETGHSYWQAQARR